MVPQEQRANQDARPKTGTDTSPLVPRYACISPCFKPAIGLPTVWIYFTMAIAVCGCTNSGPGIADSATDIEKQSVIAEMYAGYKEDFPGIAEMTAEELAAKMATEDVVVVDVREPEERAVSVIEGSISKKEFEDNLDTYKGQTVVVHCTIGYRSGVYVKKLQDKGIEAFNLPGSILSWVHAGQPVVDAEGNETKTVHVYGPKWDLLPEGYEAVW